MAKKKTKRPRKRKRLKANPKRQAHNQLRGYLYQIWHSVDAWLDLADNEILYLEGAEDFDRVSDNTATAVQVKDTQHKITLRSKEVNDAIDHYWELRTNHPDRSVKFCLLTRSKIGVERDDPFEGQPGLHVWSRCSGDKASITKISEFLQAEGKISEEVTDFLKQAEPQQIYEQLIEPIAWETDSADASSVEQSISEKVIHHGDRHGISSFNAEKVVDHLLKEAFVVATRKENRELTLVRFFKIFDDNTRVSVPIQDTRAQQPIDLKVVLDNIKAALIGDSPDITIQPQPPIQNTIPPLFPDVTSRTELLTSIQAKLQSDGIAVIQGGAGRGKTTLAKLTANDISGSWLWLNFTNRESSQAVQLLQQLAITVSNQSSPVNVVLDDLNLQLQKYEDALGIVVYAVRERSAKLLITSQHKPPNNLTRNLGVSSSVTINVPNFTESEIEQFAEQMGCPADDVKNWATLIQAHTGGHPRLVHARLDRLREEEWKQQDTIESILQTPQEVVEEREQARQLLMDFPEDRREFLYRLSLLTEFRKDYALNIGEIPESILHPGDVFSQLVGPWIDQVNETYYTISPLLTNAANQVWSESKRKDLHAQIANAILETEDLTTIEARAVLTHSMVGQNKEGLISVIHALMTAPQNDWEKLIQEFSWMRSIKTDPPEELFPGDAFVNHLFRSLQYRIVVAVEPESAPKILELWDKETKPHKPHQVYLLNRLMLATDALRYYQVSLPSKQMVGYLKEIIDITDSHKDVQEMYFNSMGQLEEYNTGKSNYFSFLFSFIYARRPIYAPFLNDLIDALDELQPEIRTLLLADFEDDTIDPRLLIDGVWSSEAERENPDWTRCLQVFDKVIEKTIAWGYPHFAAAAARCKAMIYDECLNQLDTAHKVLQDMVSKVGPSPVIEEVQASIYLHQENYKEALNIYERILPEWNPPSGQLDVMPSEGCRRAAICAAYLGDWEKAATFLEDGPKRTHKIVNPERYIGLYADAGFAQFKAGNMSDSIKLLTLALQKFGMLRQDNTDVKYFTLKKRLAGTISWMEGHERENYPPEFGEPPVAFCSDPETNEQFLTLPDCPVGYSWLNLAKIEYKFELGMTVFQQALQISDRDAYPTLSYFLSHLEAQYDFRNKTFDDLPRRIHQLANAGASVQKHHQSGKGIEEKGTYSISIADLSIFASVRNIIDTLVASLLVQLSANIDTHEILSIWRTNSSTLPTRENMIIALDLIESMLSGDENNARTVMRTPEVEYEKRIVAALKIVHNKETSPKNLFYAHTLITYNLIGRTWIDQVVKDLAELLSAQWLEKIMEMPIRKVFQIEQACKSSETGKKKIGQILLAAHQAISLEVPSEILQQFRSWIEWESKQKQEPTTGKNPIAQRLIEAMEKPPHLTHEDVEALRQSIEEGKMPIKFDSPFEPDERENQ